MSGPFDPVLGPNLNNREMDKFVACGDKTAVRTVNCIDSGEGLNLFSELLDYETADGEVCFNTYVVPAAKQFLLSQVQVAFSGSGMFIIKCESTVVAKIITSPGQTSFNLPFQPIKPLAAGETLEVCFCGPCPGDAHATVFGSLFDVIT